METIFLTCLPKYTSIASTLIRDVIRNNGGDVARIFTGCGEKIYLLEQHDPISIAFSELISRIINQ